jgi:hypothetical protein
MVDGDGDGQITKAEFLLAFKVSDTATASVSTASTAYSGAAACTKTCSIEHSYCHCILTDTLPLTARTSRPPP